MTEKQSQIIDEIYKTKMAGTEAENWWQYEMCWDYSEALKIAIAEAKIKNLSQTSTSKIIPTKDTIAKAAITTSFDLTYPKLSVNIYSDSEIERDTNLSSLSLTHIKNNQQIKLVSSWCNLFELNIPTTITSESLLRVKHLSKHNGIKKSFVKAYTGINRRDSSISIASSGYESIAE